MISDDGLKELRGLISTLKYVSLEHEKSCELQFTLSGTRDELTAVIDYLRHHGHPIHSIESTPPSLEEVFTHYTADDQDG